MVFVLFRKTCIVPKNHFVNMHINAQNVLGEMTRRLTQKKRRREVAKEEQGIFTTYFP